MEPNVLYTLSRIIFTVNPCLGADVENQGWPLTQTISSQCKSAVLDNSTTGHWKTQPQTSLCEAVVGCG